MGRDPQRVPKAAQGKAGASHSPARCPGTKCAGVEWHSEWHSEKPLNCSSPNASWTTHLEQLEGGVQLALELRLLLCCLLVAVEPGGRGAQQQVSEQVTYCAWGGKCAEAKHGMHWRAPPSPSNSGHAC